MSAARLVDLVLGTVIVAEVDVKQVVDDRFDDLTVVTAGGRRERVQFKHTDNDDKPLTTATFTSDSRDLRLDRLVAAAVADRDGPGANATDLLFRVVFRDTWPEERALTDVLVPASPDPGPFVAQMHTRRLRFDVDRLWPLGPTLAPRSEIRAVSSRFAFLRSGAKAVDRADLAWLCERLVIEVEAPKSSGIMVLPDAAEQILLRRVRTEVGAGTYPNAGRSAEDVADAFATFVRQARQRLCRPTAEAMLQRARLRRDFGAVSRANPVNRSVEIARSTTVADVRSAAELAAQTGVPLLLTGPPGQGKSWVCEQLVRALTDAGWLVAEHYCYLADTRDERDERVQAETVFGSLLGRLVDALPSIVDDHRPRYAADDVALADAVSRAVQGQAGRGIALIVDGLDHVARVLPAKPGTDPSAALARSLAALRLPTGTVLIVLSQPGDHLIPLREAGAQIVAVPSLTGQELQSLAAKFGLVAGPGILDPIVEKDLADGFVSALVERSRGNALYATYLCRELTIRPRADADPEAVLRALPPFDGTLANYYTHLTTTLGPGAVVADVIGLLDFPVTRNELEEMRPELAHWLDDALAVLAPVLTERATLGGLQVYHESFARFLRRRMEEKPAAHAANLRLVAQWLDSRGFYGDERAFRFLLPTLAAAGRDAEVLERVDAEFAANAIAGGHPASAITANLVAATVSAGRLKDLPALARCVELARAAETFEEERVDFVLTNYIDVPTSLLGGQEFASRLMFGSVPAVPARAGLQLCAAIDEAGYVAPWSDYMTAFLKWQSSNTTSYGEESDLAVSRAWVRGQLREAVGAHAGDREWYQRIASFLDDAGLPADTVIPIVVDVFGVGKAAEILGLLDKPGQAALALAELAGTAAEPAVTELTNQLLPLATRQYEPGSAHRLITLGVAPSDLGPPSVTEMRTRLLAASQTVRGPHALHSEDGVRIWLDLCAVAARRDPAILTTVESMFNGGGWYLCWLRFALALIQVEAIEHDERASLAVDALRLLTRDLHPFAGRPRACDLFPIHQQIEDTVRRAVALLDDETWPVGLAILRQVSEGVGVSMRGQDAGPITPDFLLTLAIDGATTAARRPATQALIDEALTEGGGQRYYSMLAEYRLMAARFALRGGDTHQARTYWQEACQLMTAYGWHKDITIYAVLDPIEDLIAADLTRARIRLGRLQAACERVVLHTDRKSTRGAWPRWWNLLAKADPAALTRMAVPALLSRSGTSNDLYNDALEDLWKLWNHVADPIVAAALRLALHMPLDDADAALAGRLAALAHGSGADPAGRLLTLVLARADERPLAYPYSNTHELVAEDNARVKTINEIASSVNAPQIGIEPDIPVEPAPAGHAPAQVAPKSGTAYTMVGGFPDGAVGLARAIRAWRQRPHVPTSLNWTPDRFTNIIGYRLVELATTGDQDAETYLHTLASALEMFDESGLLTALGEGMERHDQPRLAAMAHALVWTRSRGNDGWTNFGGTTQLESLRRATCLDPDAALETVVSEVARVIAGSHRGSQGVSQALIYAAAAGLEPGRPPLDVAFAAWDEAEKVIGYRTPRMAVEDDPDELYLPTEPLDDESNDIDTVFAEAVVGALAHPGRESRRRALLATRILLNYRPDVVAKAVGPTLSSLSEPASLSWLLKVIQDIGAAAPAIVQTCWDALQQHARGPHLTSRALAAKLLGDQAPPPPLATPDAALLLHTTSTLWLPDDIEPRDEAMELVDAAAGYRLTSAEEVLPGLGEAVAARVRGAMSAPDFERSINREAHVLADTRHKRWADAFVGRPVLVEDALQCAAAGGRAALLATASPPAEPGEWEYKLASLLVNDPALPLDVEATRHPRPDLPAPPRAGAPDWAAVRADRTARARRDGREDAMATVSVLPVDHADTMPAGRFRGWRIVATSETHCLLPARPEKGEAVRTSGRDRALELRLPNDSEGVDRYPFANVTTANWFTPTPAASDLVVPQHSCPLIGIDLDGDYLADTPYGLGVHSPLLVPTDLLKLILGLQPVEPLVLHDPSGPALAMITWRSHYETGAYHLPWPRRTGTALLASPSCFDALLQWAKNLLAIRETIHGDVSLVTAVETSV
ncbi:AAA family ATPase [Parafrankia sp. FMc6]|uniref:AAA family ATPase n=1 Tax=Parafrankia soli TaxID=2599596 RepID=UPI0034D72A9B